MSNDLNGFCRCGAKTAECERTGATATGSHQIKHMLAALEDEYSASEHSFMVKALHAKHGCADARIDFLLYLFSWTNLFLVSLYLTKLPVSTLDNWLCLYPIVQGFHQTTRIMASGGPLTHFQASKEPFRRFIRYVNALLVSLSLFGMLCYFLRESRGGQTILDIRYAAQPCCMHMVQSHEDMVSYS